jgi:hypothetical protein
MSNLLRRVKNSQRANIAYRDGTPSKTTITEGEELMAIRKNKGLSLFRRQKGILWWLNFTKDGSQVVEKDLKVEGSSEFSKNLTVKGNLSGQRAYFDAGESSAFSGSRYLNYNDGTIMTSNNGYIMMRPGSITGISTCFNGINTSGGGMLYLTAVAKINGTDKFSPATIAWAVNTYGQKAQRVQDRGIDNFVAGDVLGMYASVTGAGMIVGDVDNMNVIVEVTYDT